MKSVIFILYLLQATASNQYSTKHEWMMQGEFYSKQTCEDAGRELGYDPRLVKCLSK